MPNLVWEAGGMGFWGFQKPFGLDFIKSLLEIWYHCLHKLLKFMCSVILVILVLNIPSVINEKLLI